MKVSHKLDQKSIAQVMLMAMDDSGFRSELKKTPKNVIENTLQITTERDFKILENTDTVNYIVIPYFSDEEIQKKEKEINSLAKSQNPISALNILIFNCARDEKLKQKLIENPKQFIEQECHITFPENMTIKVEEDSKKLMHIIIPSKNAELSDEEIKQLSGGVVFIAALIGLIYVAGKQQLKDMERNPGYTPHALP